MIAPPLRMAPSGNPAVFIFKEGNSLLELCYTKATGEKESL
jgi:hypothetical protein